VPNLSVLSSAALPCPLRLVRQGLFAVTASRFLFRHWAPKVLPLAPVSHHSLPSHQLGGPSGMAPSVFNVREPLFLSRLSPRIVFQFMS
jgi:hypothetical protein